MKKEESEACLSDNIASDGHANRQSRERETASNPIHNCSHHRPVIDH